MTIKNLDNILDGCLWGVAALLIGLSWLVADKITAPEYEPVVSEVAIPYSFEADDGDRIESTYGLAWHHKSFSSPVPVAYDPQYDKMSTFKEEYLDTYRAQMSPSHYNGIWYHMFWVWFVIFAIGCSVLVIAYGPDIRDAILVNRIKKSPKFLDCTYFLYHDRSESSRKKVMPLVPWTAINYLQANRRSLESRFSPTLYQLIMQWMQMVKISGSTTIDYTYRFDNQLTQQKQYLQRLVTYWNDRRGIDPNADKNLSYVKRLLDTGKYVDIPAITESYTYTSSVTDQLKKLFTEVMGAEVFNFSAIKQISGFHYPSRIYVTTRLLNDVRDFTWSGSAYSGYSFPGIRIIFTISQYVNNEERVLWSRELPPKCTYRATDSDFSVKDLYTNMVVQTIDTFTENLKKG